MADLRSYWAAEEVDSVLPVVSVGGQLGHASGRQSAKEKEKESAVELVKRAPKSAHARGPEVNATVGGVRDSYVEQEVAGLWHTPMTIFRPDGTNAKKTSVTWRSRRAH